MQQQQQQPKKKEKFADKTIKPRPRKRRRRTTQKFISFTKSMEKVKENGKWKIPKKNRRLLISKCKPES